MRAYLMFKDKNFKVDNIGMYNFEVTLADIEIETILRSIADKDLLMVNVLRCALANPLYDIEEIRYRQDVLKDAIDNPDVVREMYQICQDTATKIKKYWFGSSSGSLSNTYVSALDHLSYFIVTHYFLFRQKTLF